ncbi:MAG: LuxR C-terminal-related transcriptional regulator [Bryobacteraceae bacterium]|jgi:DNA-binding CsgD family transcriptional regulator
MNASDKRRVHGLREGIAQLRREKSQLLQLIAAAPVGFALLDQDLRFVRINAALKVIDGHLANEHIGQTLREVMPEQASALEPLCREVLQNQEPILNVPISSVPLHGRANARVCLASLYAVRPDGKTLNLGLIIRDVSSYKLETIGQFSSLMAEDLNAVVAAITGSFNLTLDNLPESHPAFTALKRTLQSSAKSAQLIRQLLALAGKSGPLLTGRERQILQLIADGKSSKEIAKALKISFRTVAAHRSAIMNKFDVHEAASLIRHAIRQGLIQP